MGVLSNLDITNTDNSKLLENEKETDFKKSFKALFDHMGSLRIKRLFFLSSLFGLAKLEGIEFTDEIKRTLMEERIPDEKAQKISKTVSSRTYDKISEKRAVSIRAGMFGLIEPFDQNRIKLNKVCPSINHIYGSYFTNCFATLDVLKKKDSKIEYSQILRMFKGFETDIGEFKEELEICEKCDTIINSKLECSHPKINLKLFKLKPEILLGWEKGVILPGYIAYYLKKHKWDAYAEKIVVGTGGCKHQIDVIAEKDERIALFECKHYDEIRVSREELMKGLGAMEDLERNIRAVSTDSIDVMKIFVTTSTFHGEIRNFNERDDVLLFDKQKILLQPDKWVRELEQD
jgi:hypothetical protein